MRMLYGRAYFAALQPLLATWLTHPFVRGAVSGVGIVSVVAAVMEIGTMLSRRTVAPQVPGA